MAGRNPLAKRLTGFDAPTVWMEFTTLSQTHKSVNLGQGFPDWATADFAKKAFIDAINADHNQYARSAGDPALVTALANHYSPLLNLGRPVDPLSEVTVSVGATEALYAIMQSMISEGDEVVVLEPAFDIYPAQVQMAGGVCRFVPVEMNPTTKKWEVDMTKLEAAITPKTKILLLNTPHNPTGKVFTRAELEQVAGILERNPHVTGVTDEVYEKLVYDNHTHIRLASLPGMWDRVLTVSSCGKTFSCTGWKVGWVLGAAHLVKPITLANQWVQYCVSTPAQRAVAVILAEADMAYTAPKTGKVYPSYYEFIRLEYERKRNELVESLKIGGLHPYVPEGGYFIVADTAKYSIPDKYIQQPGPNGESPVTRDWGFARWLTVEKGITPIPLSAFYTPQSKHLAANFARFAICKTDESLAEARIRFEALGTSTSTSSVSPDA